MGKAFVLLHEYNFAPRMRKKVRHMKTTKNSCFSSIFFFFLFEQFVSFSIQQKYNVVDPEVVQIARRVFVRV